jgi:hypothetical protein
MPTLKEILDKFGWEKIQQGQMPPEIKPEGSTFCRRVHQYDLYALNGVCAVVEDGTDIVELSGIAKTPYGYTRKAQTPQNSKVTVRDTAAFLEGFMHLHRFKNVFLFVKEEGMHFDGIGKRVEEAGQLYHS